MFHSIDPILAKKVRKNLLWHSKCRHVYAIFTIKPQDKGVIDSLRSDDLVGRQSILVRDASSLGLKENNVVLLLEGSKEALDLARKIGGDKMTPVKEKDSSDLYSRFKDDESKADEGVGFLFG